MEGLWFEAEELCFIIRWEQMPPKHGSRCSQSCDEELHSPQVRPLDIPVQQSMALPCHEGEVCDEGQQKQPLTSLFPMGPNEAECVLGEVIQACPDGGDEQGQHPAREEGLKHETRTAPIFFVVVDAHDSGFVTG